MEAEGVLRLGQTSVGEIESQRTLELNGSNGRSD